MKQIMEDFCNRHGHGLLLLDMPTGGGKTSQALDFIRDCFVKREETLFNSEPVIYFITTLKKNLPENDLKKKFVEAGEEVLFEKLFLRLWSNTESVCINLTEEMVKAIPEICFSQEYKNLVKIVNAIRVMSKNDIFKITENSRLCEEQERAFRLLIRRLLREEFKREEERQEAIVSDERWKWVGELYPASRLAVSKIVFMSIDKFLYPVDPIYSQTMFLYEKKNIKNKVVIIDEFDSTKTNMINVIIKTLREGVNYQEIIRRLYKMLRKKRFHSSLLKSINSDNNEEMKARIDNIISRAKKVFKKYLLDYNHILNKAQKDKEFGIIFRDENITTVTSAGKEHKFVTRRLIKDEPAYKICFEENKPRKEKENLVYMVNEMNNFMTFFLYSVKVLAANYRDRENEQNKNKEGFEELTEEQAIYTVLEEFSLQEYKSWMCSEIKKKYAKINNEILIKSLQTFYERGFSYCYFMDNPNHDLQTHILTCNSKMTPEIILLGMCEAARVIGLSATATVDTVTHNFPIGFFKMRLGSDFYEISETDRSRLEAEYLRRKNFYKNIRIHVEAVKPDVQGGSYEKAWNKVIANIELARGAKDVVERFIFGKKATYSTKKFYIERYLKIAEVFKCFYETKTIMSFLCMLNSYPRIDHGWFNLDLLYQIASFIITDHTQGMNLKKAKNQAQRMISVLDSNDFDNKKENILSRLGNGEKLIVLTTYPALAVGQNLQYPVPLNLDGLVYGGDNRKEKDFDGIYLEKPTHIVPQFTENWEWEEYLRFIWIIEYLKEYGELSKMTAMDYNRKAIKCYYSKKMQQIPQEEPLKERNSIRAAGTKMIYQGLGRINRTEVKSKDIYVFYDDDIREMFALSIDDGKRIFPQEMKELIKHIRAGGEVVSNLEDTAINRLKLLSERMNAALHKEFLGKEWTNQKIQEWKQLRKLSRGGVNRTSDSLKGEKYGDLCYVKTAEPVKAIYYSQKGDYKKIKVSLSKTNDCKQEVSYEAAKIDVFKRIPGFWDYYESIGGHAESEACEYIMTPVVFNNIYKGDLGEQAGKYILESYCGVKLEEITDTVLFEKFDYRIFGTDIYVDFKNWNEQTNKGKCDEQEIYDKLRLCNGSCAMIINAVGTTNFTIHKMENEDMTIYTIPALFLEDEEAVNEAAVAAIRRCVYEQNQI